MWCGHPDCTGNHHGYPNLCPATVERSRLRHHEPKHMEKHLKAKRRRYANLSGYAYAYMLLKHRRNKALDRMERRSPWRATEPRTKQT